MDIFRLLHVSRLLLYSTKSNTMCSEGTNGRALTYGAGVAGGSTNMTVSNCLAACQGASYDLAGIEYSGECCKFTSHDVTRRV